MRGYFLQVTLAAALLLVCAETQTLLDRPEQPSYPSNPQLSIFNFNRGAEQATPAERPEQVLLIAIPRPQERLAHLVSLAHALRAAAQRSPAPPTFNSYPSNQEDPCVIAVEDFRAPAPIQPTLPPQPAEKHYSLFDVKLAAPPAIIINSYPRTQDPNLIDQLDRARGVVEAAHTIGDANLKPAIDVRSSESKQQVSRVSSQSTSQDRQLSVTVGSNAPATQTDGNRPYRSTEEKPSASNDPVIVFPQEDAQSSDDSVELLVPFDRLRRNVVSLENFAGSGQIGYPVYRYPQLQQAYLRYPQQYPVRPIPSYSNELCPWGSCYGGSS